jgi:hypothetical protein
VNIEVVAASAVALLALAAAFQLGLAAGAPWGAAAYGGRPLSDNGALPSKYRFGSGVATLLLLGAIWVVLASVSLVDRGPASATLLNVLVWCLAAMFALSTLGNARGRHPLERWGAGTITALLTVLCAVVAAH